MSAWEARESASNSAKALNCEQTIALDCEQGQVAGRVSAGVDVDPVRADIRDADRGMAVDDIFAEASFGLEEFLADPEQILLLLAFQSYAWLDTGVHKEEVATREGRAELLKKRKMPRRKRLPQPFDQLNL